MSEHEQEVRKVVVEIDLAGLYARDDSLADYIAGRAVAELLRVDLNLVAEFRRRVAAITEGEIREAVRPLIGEALEKVVQPTDAFGTPKGAPTTLHEMIVELARKELTQKRGDSRGRQTTIVEDFVKAEVEVALGKELQEEIRGAKADVLAAVRERAGEVIAETIDRLSAGRPI